MVKARTRNSRRQVGRLPRCYGQEGNTYIVFTPMKSAAEVDKGFDQDKQFVANMGEDGMKSSASCWPEPSNQPAQSVSYSVLP